MKFDKEKIAELKDQLVETSKAAGKAASEKIKEAKLDEKIADAGAGIAQFANQAGKATAETAKKIGETTTAAAVKASDAINDAIVKGKEKQQKKKEMNFQSVDSLQQVVNVVNEAAEALNDASRTMRESAIGDVIAGALGAGVGGVGSFALLYGLGAVGLSAAGITSGLAAAGAIIGGGMVAGIFVLAAPIAALAGAGVLTAEKLKSKQLRQEKERLYEEALKKHEAIIKALKEESDADKERLDYLQGLNILLQQAVKDLKEDIELGKA